MSEPKVDPNQLSEKDQAALAAADGMGLSGLGQPKTEPAPAAAPAPVVPEAAPKGVKEVKPAPQPGTGTAPVAPVADPIEIKSPLGAKTFGAADTPVLSSFEDVQVFAKEHGLELESVDSIRSVITKMGDLQKKAEEAEVLASQVNQYKSQFGNLPPDVANIVDAAINGREYKTIIKDIAAGATLDLSRSFEEHNAVNLIRQYVQPGITQEQYDELTDANKEAMASLAKVNYDTAQAKWNQATADQTATKKAYDQNYQQSLNVALAKVKEQFPTMDDATLKIVHDKMAYGLKDSLFNPDNTYKPDAGVKIAMQEFGLPALQESYNTIGGMMEKMRGQIQGETQEQLLLRSDKPNQQGRQAADTTNVIADAVAQQTRFLNAQ